MKLDSKNIGLMAILVAISIGATYALTSQFTVESFGVPNPSSGAFMSGHVQAVVTDENDNIIAYRQADNAIVISGMDIIANQVFYSNGAAGSNMTNTTGSPSFGSFGPVGWMNIGNNTGGAIPAAADAELACPLEQADTTKCGGTNGQEDTPQAGCGSQLAQIGTSGGRDYLGPGGSAQVNVTAVATFDGAQCASIAIQEAGMWNNATGPTTGGDDGQLFARNTFGAVTLTTTDSLELTWRFTFTDN